MEYNLHPPYFQDGVWIRKIINHSLRFRPLRIYYKKGVLFFSLLIFQASARTSVTCVRSPLRSDVASSLTVSRFMGWPISMPTRNGGQKFTSVKNVGTRPESQKSTTSTSKRIIPTVLPSSNFMTSDTSNSQIPPLQICYSK